MYTFGYIIGWIFNKKMTWSWQGIGPRMESLDNILHTTDEFQQKLNNKFGDIRLKTRKWKDGERDVYERHRYDIPSVEVRCASMDKPHIWFYSNIRI